MAQLETLLALVEGWVDTVVADAVGDRLPGAPALRETLRRRRATGGPAEQTFATLIGLELRPRRLRAAAELWRRVGASRGIDGRDALWARPRPAAVAGGPGRPGRFHRPGQGVQRAAGRPGDIETELLGAPAERRRIRDRARPDSRRDRAGRDQARRRGPAPRAV